MIKQPLLLVVSLVLLVVAIGLAVERTLFLMSALKTTGNVVLVQGRNDTCGSKKNRHSCTRFAATVEYTPQAGGVFHLEVSAGDARGSNQPITSASLAKGSSVPVVYAPKNPGKAYQNTLFGVWGAPLIAAGGQIATLIGSMSEGRRRRRW